MREDPQQDRRADIKYEDDLLLVCLKPRGVLSCKDASGKESMEDLLFHDRNRNKTYAVKRERKGVKAAKLYYRVLERREGETMVHVRLYTGRTHQIRVQFASRGFPLKGDRKYGSQNTCPIALEAYRLEIMHPKGHKLSFALSE